MPGGTAVIGVAASPATPLPPFARAALDLEISGLLYLALNVAEWGDGGLRYPEEHPLAVARRRWKSENGRTLTYRLDPRHRWSDGQPVRAGDAVFTYALLADAELGLPLSSTTERLDSVTALDDSTVAFHFRAPYPGMEFDTGVGLLPAHVFGDRPATELRGFAPPRDGGNPSLVVDGPFRLVEWRPEERIVLARNETSPAAAWLDRLVIRVIPDEPARLTAFRRGDLDLIQITSYREAARLERDPDVRLLRIPQRGYDYIAWNPRGHPAFADPRVRRALSLAIDREQVLAALDMTAFGEPASGPYGSLFEHLMPTGANRPPFDPERARRLLEEAGWRDADGDGVRERGGTDLTFELATTAGNERRESAAQILQAQLAAVGARARIRVEEFGALLDRVIGRRYEAALLGWQVGLDPDISPFWYDPESPFNVVGYRNEEVRAAIDSARAQPTVQSAAPYWRKAASLIAADHPYAFLWFFDLPIAVGPRLRNVEADATGFLTGAHRWWIPPREDR